MRHKSRQQHHEASRGRERHHTVQDAPRRDGRKAEGPTKPRPGREDLERQAKEFSQSRLPKEPENEKVLRDRGDHVCIENRTEEDSPTGRPWSLPRRG